MSVWCFYFSRHVFFGGASWFLAKYPGRELMNSSIFHLAWNQGNKMNCQLGQRGRQIWYLLCQRIAWKLAKHINGSLAVSWTPNGYQKHPKTFNSLYIHYACWSHVFKRSRVSFWNPSNWSQSGMPSDLHEICQAHHLLCALFGTLHTYLGVSASKLEAAFCFLGDGNHSEVDRKVVNQVSTKSFTETHLDRGKSFCGTWYLIIESVSSELYHWRFSEFAILHAAYYEDVVSPWQDSGLSSWFDNNTMVLNPLHKSSKLVSLF